MKLSLIITHVQHIIQYRGYNTVEHIRLSTYQILLFRLLKFTPHHTRAYQIFTYSVKKNDSASTQTAPYNGAWAKKGSGSIEWSRIKKKGPKKAKKEEEKREYHRRTVIEYSYRTEALLIIRKSPYKNINGNAWQTAL